MNSSPAVPQHVAIICDGNRRWAKEHGLEVFLGHQKAVDEVFEPLIDRASERGVKYITFWVFSTENWQRASQEVSYLLQLLRDVFDKQVKRLHEKNMRVQVIGDTSKFDQDIQDRITDGIELTMNNSGITVIFALNYGGRDEILRAVERVQLDHPDEKITEHMFSSYLDTMLIPDPDFVIRTGGEQRLSGFLLWQIEYAELAFPEFYFPDFTPEKLDELLAEYASRKRRFGK
mgnify:CR=1 FL=1